MGEADLELCPRLCPLPTEREVEQRLRRGGDSLNRSKPDEAELTVETQFKG